MKSRSRIHPLYAEMGTTVFERMSALARELGAVNLGQGFPDGPAPPPLLKAAQDALVERSNQYPPSGGLPELRAAIADFYTAQQGLDLEPADVVVTSGATEALACAIFGLVQPGDEVILFQPAYDAYAPLVRRAGGTPVSVPLKAPGFQYEATAIEAAVTPRTRLLVLNDPLNPSGTVASAEELGTIARICMAHDLVAICDEVWEQVRFDGQRHRSLMDMQGMAERCVKIGSAGKIFGLTGWKIGWMVARGDLAVALGRVHQFLTFTTPVPLQWAVAAGLGMTDVLDELHAAWAASRQRLGKGLEGAGFAVLPNAATWFLCIDLAASGIELDDRTFSERAVREGGVATVPVSALFEGEGAPTHLVRVCFTKPDAVVDEAVARLANWRASL
ncbi:aminotransferase [Novosphingobium panipatense]|uniref:Aspartate/methionine/tyrosine aminotransferase n=1 Tax=Novosphingobium panipatense TaxID=428991 RepID=A0ABY1QR44_9SPHN|nr:aminotransferase [Novosphingobium panipatense]SMP78132.1 Aspartate/methionine/tyrosine aminotransferase [Novosphingobium panipatense]